MGCNSGSSKNQVLPTGYLALDSSVFCCRGVCILCMWLCVYVYVYVYTCAWSTCTNTCAHGGQVWVLDVVFYCSPSLETEIFLNLESSGWVDRLEHWPFSHLYPSSSLSLRWDHRPRSPHLDFSFLMWMLGPKWGLRVPTAGTSPVIPSPQTTDSALSIFLWSIEAILSIFKRLPHCVWIRAIQGQPVNLFTLTGVRTHSEVALLIWDSGLTPNSQHQALHMHMSVQVGSSAFRWAMRGMSF